MTKLSATAAVLLNAMQTKGRVTITMRDGHGKREWDAGMALMESGKARIYADLFSRQEIKIGRRVSFVAEMTLVEA